MHLRVTDYDGVEHRLEAIEGWRVMEVIRDWGLDIKAECGGALACATCHVYVAQPWLDKLHPASEEEENMLDTVPDTRENSRLSCQLLMKEELDGLEVTLAPSSRSSDEAA